MSVCWKKRPADRLDFDVTFGKWLADGDVFLSATVTIEGTGAATIYAFEVYLTFIKVWIEGGLADERYTVSVTGVTNFGRTKKKSYPLVIRDRC